MRRTGRQVLLGMVASTALALLMVAGLVNLVMRAYIDDQARLALAEAAAWLRDEDISEDDLLFWADTLYLDGQGRTADADMLPYLDARTRHLAQYVQAHLADIQGRPYWRAQVGGQDYYLSWLDRSQIGDEAADYAFAYLEEGGVPVAGVVCYVDLSPLTRLSASLNLAFILGALACALLAGLAGFRTGLRIDSAEERMKAFFQNASHELKTPLMSLQGYAEGIETGIISDTRGAGRVMLEESERMAALVDELLYLSRIDSGRAAPALAPVDLRELLYDCMDRAQPLAQRQGLTIGWDSPPEPAVVLGDEAQLTRVFVNILSNATRYAHSRIALTLQGRGRYIAAAFEDDGDGIAEKDLPHIFERFYTGQRGSTGVGLSLARQIVLLHHGRIYAENTGHGARFTVELKSARGH